MTAEENKAIVRRYIDELNRRIVVILDELVADEFRETVRQGYLRNITAFPDYLVEIQDMVAEGDQVVVEWTHRGTHTGMYNSLPPTGKMVTGRAISIYRVKDSQIVDAHGAWDQAFIWQQLGLIPDTETIVNNRSIALVTLLVREYDEAIAFFTDALRFTVVEDTPLGDGNRWVVVAPPGSRGTSLVLARAATEEQLTYVGDQTGGRVFLFLHTSNFWNDYHHMQSRGVRFVEEPRQETYGRVVVFFDLYSNKWDLVEPNHD
jgi:lactoylglutathione lyase